GTARNRGGQRALAFAQIIIAGERVFHFSERAQRGAYVACGGGFLLGGAEILCSLKFTAEENRLRDSSRETPNEGIERTDRVECRGSKPARGAENKARQARGASLIHAMKGSGEAALAGDEIRPALEDLRGQTGWHRLWLAGGGAPPHKCARSGAGGA